MAAWIRMLALGLLVPAISCASGEDVDDGKALASGGGAADAAGIGGAAGGSGWPGTGGSGDGGWPGGGGFAGGGSSGDGGWPGGSGGTSAGGSSSGGGSGGCSTEICNGKDDDCDGSIDDSACSAGCKGATYQSHGYAICTPSKDLSKAAEDCVAQKMKIARPNDLAENDWLRSTATAASLGAFWLGATDWTTEGQWYWPDGTLFWTGGPSGAPAAGGLYINWGTGQPAGSGAADCMQMDAGGFWVETACGKSAGYVCEDY